MDFKNANFLNTRVNLISGNLLPIVSDNSRFSVTWRIHSAVVWLIELIHTIALTVGMALAPKEKSLKDGTIAVVITLEASFMLTRLYLRKKLMKEIIEKMDDVLQSADEIMKDIVKSAIKPITMPFIIYGVTGVITVATWTIQPILLVFEKSTFYYVDYNLPTAFNNEPFSTRVLILSTIFMTIGSSYLFLKKFGVDVYMMHLVLLLTAQYRYTAVKLTILFRGLQNCHDETKKKYCMEDRWTERELRKLCVHQNNVLNMSFILRKLLSVNFSLLYFNNVFRFCFIGILLSTSTEITDKAFDEGWYQFGPWTKSTFILLIMSNSLECRIAAIGKFNLSLPSFMTVKFINEDLLIMAVIINVDLYFLCALK
ncbi:hypothetical protein ALC57_11486 [Trachymyrmex cornetzi]|uniref:Odorant receptor n=1 Tax=Trachymyrmex cornetzi TaxID=471704 RepID=A0A195DTP2_9HYME|nr:hypothetical protein ALC57_11486 [Trachymyrmex cornetzi]